MSITPIGIEYRYIRTDSSGFFNLSLPRKDRKKLKAIEVSFLNKKTRVNIDKKKLRHLEYGRTLTFDTTDTYKFTGTISYLLKPYRRVYYPKKRHLVMGKIRIRRRSLFTKIFNPKRSRVAMDKLKAEDKKD